jgi:hypothetical protein
MHAKICMYVCMHASCKACITISYRVRVLSGRQTCRGVDLQVYAPSDRGPAMSRLRPSLASRWGCGSRLRRIWITLASAIVLLQVVLFRCRHVCACVCMYVYMWRPCSDWSLSSPAFPACTDAISALRWRARVQVAVARTYPCPASAQEGCPPLQCAGYINY